MYVVQYILLFVAAMVLSIGAFLGYARGFASLLGAFAWFIVGNASSAVVFWDASGARQVVTSVPLTWLCYAVGFVHLVVLLIEIHEMLTEEDNVDSLDQLPEQMDPNMQRQQSEGEFQ